MNTIAMKAVFIFLLIFVCSCSEYKGSKDSLSYDNIEIIFDGYSKEFETTGEISITITNSTDVQNLNNLKKLSEPKLFGNVKGTDYVIRLIYKNSDTGDQLLIQILKSINSEPTIEYGTGTIFDRSYKNDELVDYVASLIRLDAIKQYKGSISQEGYDELIIKRKQPSAKQ